MTEKLNSAVYFTKTVLVDDYLPLYTPFVKGQDYSVFVDSGIKSIFPQLIETMKLAGTKDSDLRFVVQTHSHADHIGCNVALKKRTGCLIAGHKMYAHWHTDPERHYHEWARTIPSLIPDTPELKASVLDWFNEPHHIDVFVDEGTIFDLGGGVTLEAFSFPGHQKNDLGWLESSTRTMLLGDAITATTWPHFHIHETVAGYRSTIEKFRRVVRERKVDKVFMTHFGAMPASEVLVMADKSEAFLQQIDRTLLRVVSAEETVSMEEIWEKVASAVGKTKDHYSLTSIYSHVVDFLERGLIREVSPLRYALR